MGGTCVSHSLARAVVSLFLELSFFWSPAKRKDLAAPPSGGAGDGGEPEAGVAMWARALVDMTAHSRGCPPSPVSCRIFPRSPSPLPRTEAAAGRGEKREMTGKKEKDLLALYFWRVLHFWPPWHIFFSPDLVVSRLRTRLTLSRAVWRLDVSDIRLTLSASIAAVDPILSRHTIWRARALTSARLSVFLFFLFPFTGADRIFFFFFFSSPPPPSSSPLSVDILYSTHTHIHTQKKIKKK